ncbi:type II toxin-antitoxin system Phd/YefM family antitoxin [Limnoglobus roseus]|uniref:Antitoxin n=1 Tax=Limnoglobus roseus TaxID=2598579 RepID=A0A5C1AUZ0_9BACT|nr:type II toxin-antitoxin system prevent-host-death family antitoxin [Limnoglobus roseus]QEL21084.1 hypothetical protein PX52LOC_08213 [Limnoglobus roseus]
MSTVTIQEAQANLFDLIRRLSPGDEVLITENNQPVAKLVVPPAEPPPKPRQFGTMKGSVLYMAPDFDGPLDDFAEYM